MNKSTLVNIIELLQEALVLLPDDNQYVEEDIKESIQELVKYGIDHCELLGDLSWNLEIADNARYMFTANTNKLLRGSIGVIKIVGWGRSPLSTLVESEDDGTVLLTIYKKTSVSFITERYGIDIIQFIRPSEE